MDSSSWYEKLPLSEFDDDKSVLMMQLRTTKWSSKIQFYRKVRAPLSVQDLLNDMRGNQLIWIDEKSFILSKKLPKSVPYGMKFRKATTNIDFARKSVYIYGISDDIVASATARLLCLKDEKAETVRIGNNYSRIVDPLVPTTFLTSGFLQKYVRTNPNRRFVLGRGCHLSRTESVALASFHEPLDVGLECMFEDWGRTFVETLSKRTSDFGVLSLQNRSYDSLYSKYSSFRLLSEVMRAVRNISLDTTSLIFKGSQCLLPLSSPARRVEYEVWNQIGFDEIESLTMVSRAVTLVFVHSLPAKFHTLFLQASGELREMGLIYDVSHMPSRAQQTELLEAIRTNQNLKRLELGCISLLDEFWYELLETIGSHGTLQTVVFWVRSRLEVDQTKTLVAFMEKHIYLNIVFKYRGPRRAQINELEAAVGPIRLQNRARALTRESIHARPALLGAALTNWALGDFHKTNRLLTENADILCSLAAHPPFLEPRRRRRTRSDTEDEPRVIRARLE